MADEVRPPDFLWRPFIVVAFGASLALAVATVSIIAWRAASTSPIKALRKE